MSRERYAQRKRRSSAFDTLVGVLLVALLAGCVLVGSQAVIAVVGLGDAYAGLEGSPVADPTDDGLTSLADPTGPPSGTPTIQPTTVAPSSPTPLPSPTLTSAPTPDATPPATPTPTPRPKPTPHLVPRPAAGPFEMDLYRKGQFVTELKDYWCVAAAMQTMIDVMDPHHPDTSYDTQHGLYYLARKLSTKKLEGSGAEPEGWAGGLNKLGYGPYVVSISAGRHQAIHIAARALRLTGRPVGVVTWRGAHSWVMSGFRATADPAYTNDYEVTGIFIEDVWYPRISSIWGPSDPPDTFDPVAHLPVDYLPFRRPDVAYPDRDGKFVLILPVAKPAA